MTKCGMYTGTKIINYTHSNRGTVVYEDVGNEQITYIFRGNPCTNFEQVKELFACL
ncbi:hypothetical protein bcere0009_30010 [Bacillus cereus R309803]|nr:hypothetical protein bcere0009_30010 [Bacillus cereus R309803]